MFSYTIISACPIPDTALLAVYLKYKHLARGKEENMWYVTKSAIYIISLSMMSWVWLEMLKRLLFRV